MSWGGGWGSSTWHPVSPLMVPQTMARDGMDTNVYWLGWFVDLVDVVYGFNGLYEACVLTLLEHHISPRKA